MLRADPSINFCFSFGHQFLRPAIMAADQVPFCGIIRMHEVTQILNAIDQGDPQAAEQLLPLVYDELWKLAAQKLSQEKPGQTLSATALVHDAYVRLVDTDAAQQWNSRGHFFAAAAEAMRRILVDAARQKSSQRCGGGWQRQEVLAPRFHADQ